MGNFLIYRGHLARSILGNKDTPTDPPAVETPVVDANDKFIELPAIFPDPNEMLNITRVSYIIGISDNNSPCVYLHVDWRLRHFSSFRCHVDNSIDDDIAPPAFEAVVVAANDQFIGLFALFPCP